MALFSDAGIQFLFRWIHFLSGITWIGLLYYFNFVQGPFMAEADAATKSGATQKLVPRALWWFRWSAAVTFLAGVVILGLRRASWSDPWGLTILTGAAFGTVMRSEEHTSELQSRLHLVCRLLLEKKTGTLRSIPRAWTTPRLNHTVKPCWRTTLHS